VLERDSRRLVGVVTDRDIVCRAVAEGRGHGIQVRRIMTTDPGLMPDPALSIRRGYTQPLR